MYNEEKHVENMSVRNFPEFYAQVMNSNILKTKANIISYNNELLFFIHFLWYYYDD